MFDPREFDNTQECAACGEIGYEEDMILYQKDWYHEECAPNLVRCSWCGRGLERGNCVKVGKDCYHGYCYVESEEK